MQTRANAEIVAYSAKIQKPGDQRYEAQYDRQKGSQGSPQKSSNRKTNQG